MNISEESADSDVDENGAPQESLDQIREILFGNQSRDIDGRFQEVTARLSAAVGDLHSLLNERTGAISRELEQEVHHVKDEMTAIGHEFGKKVSELDSKLANATNDLRQQIAALSETMSKATRELRSDVENRLEEMNSQFSAQLDAVRAQMQAEIGKLSDSTVSRRSFSETLKELSHRFEDEQ